MVHVQNNAQSAVQEMLVKISLQNNLSPVDSLYATDYMDDGSIIKLKLTINREKKSAIFDFTGTENQVFGNTNAPKAVTSSAVIYCLRCLVKEEIPLNQGCLNPIEIIIPKSSLLFPNETAAVVGGNVLTSQRVTDVILSAFGACANSQGCMNNLTFGNEIMGYYETICGGSGAGLNFHGTNAVQVHMTNTRITDAEILERRYPVLLTEFSVRKFSGGKGLWNGGDGCIRQIMFLQDNFSVGILSERRALPPNGLKGGENAQRGKNHLLKKDGSILNLGPKNTIMVNCFDSIQILTPGGGGFGKKKKD